MAVTAAFSWSTVHQVKLVDCAEQGAVRRTMNRQKSQVTVHYVASTTFTLDSGYSDLKAIGRGSYGVVCSAFSAKLDRKVAIKKITPVSKNAMDVKHVLREIKLMRHMGKHENIITLEDLIFRETSDELYIVMELLDSDLHRIIQSKQPLTESHFKHFFFQLMCGVKYLHDNKIIHRDLKPGNLLVSKDCKLRITDFGLAREKPDNIEDGPMTEHVVTRWYRSPELMLCPDGLYSYPVDIWSCGCILAEMLGRNPLFPGKTFIHQLSLVFDVIGSPAGGDVQHIVNSEALAFLQTQKGKRKVAFSTIYPHAESSAWKLLDEMLAFRPDRRSDADEILQSPYLRGVGSPASLVFPETSPEFEFPFENPDITRYQLKQLLLAEIVSFRKERYPETSNGRGGSRVKPTTQETSVPRAASTSRRASAGASASAHVTEEASHAERKDRAASANRRASSAASGAGKYEEEKAAPAEPARDENIPSYLRGTGNFRSRAASAPRVRPSGTTKGKPGAQQRSEAKDLDDVSVTSGSVASRNRRASRGNTMVVPVGKGIAGMGEGSLVDGDETPRRSTEYQPGMVAARPLSASQRASQKALAAQAVGEESMNAVRTSTMRNLLNMCDELYAEPSKLDNREAKNVASPRRAFHDSSAAVRAESKDDFVRTGPVVSGGGGYGLRDSKSAWSEEAPVPVRASISAARSPVRPGKTEAWAAPVEEKQSAGQRAGGWGGEVYSRPDHKQQEDGERSSASAAGHNRASSAAEPKHRYDTSSLAASTDRLRLDEATASRGTRQPDSESEDGSAGEDSDSEAATPVPRSPPRKSIMQTYTSPTRLKASQPSGSPMQRAQGAGGIGSPARQQQHPGTSLAEKLVERARLLAAAVPNPPAAEVNTRNGTDKTTDRTASSGNAHAHSRFAAREDSEADDDSSQGHHLGKVHPTPPAPAAAVSVAPARYESQRTEGIAGGKYGLAEETARPESRKLPEDVIPPHSTEKQRKFTVAKSPKFSLMSWQKRRDEQREAEERLAAQLLEDSKRKTRDLGKTTKPSANGNYFGYQPPGAKRSDSAPRGRR